MWPLIKAELSYQKLLLFTASGVLLAILTFLWFSPDLVFLPEIPFPRRISISLWFLFYIAFVVLINAVFLPSGIQRREKRNRLLNLLPLSLQQLGITRIIFTSSVWTGLIGIFLLFLWFTGDWNIFWEEPAWPQALVSLCGAFLTGSAYVLAMGDLQTLFPKEKKLLGMPTRSVFNVFVVLSTVIYFLGICYAILQCIPGARFSVRILMPLVAFMVQSWTGATVFLLTGLGVALVSIRTFGLRKSFLE